MEYDPLSQHPIDPRTELPVQSFEGEPTKGWYMGREITIATYHARVESKDVSLRLPDKDVPVCKQLYVMLDGKKYNLPNTLAHLPNPTEELVAGGDRDDPHIGDDTAFRHTLRDLPGSNVEVTIVPEENSPLSGRIVAFRCESTAPNIDWSHDGFLINKPATLQ